MNEIIIIDIETTGLSVDRCEITEIGALRVDGDSLEVVDKFEMLIDIEGPVPYFITNLTGITKDMLTSKGVPVKTALTALSEFCGTSRMYAHNSSFDKRFIRHYLDESDTTFHETDWIDTIKIFKEHLPGSPNYKLETLIRKYDLADEEDHRAISDAMHTLELIRIAKSKKDA